MPDRDIFCYECNVYMGTIRDAKLRRDLVTLCGSCYPTGPEEEVPHSGPATDGTVDYLKGLFGMDKNKRRGM